MLKSLIDYFTARHSQRMREEGYKRFLRVENPSEYRRVFGEDSNLSLPYRLLGMR